MPQSTEEMGTMVSKHINEAKHLGVIDNETAKELHSDLDNIVLTLKEAYDN